jgi:glucose/arabinose dehydrogenase
MNSLTRLLLATTLALATAACGGGDKTTPEPAATEAVDSPSPAASPSASARAGFDPRGDAFHPKVAGTIAKGLDVPWGLAFLPDKTALVSERDSALIKHIDLKGKVTEVGKVPGVVPGGEGGLLGIAVAPDFDKKPMLYAYLTAEKDNRIVRMTYSESKLGTPEVIASGIQKANIHNGGRIAFGPDGMLYAGTGDANRRELAGRQESLNGKILRMTKDGKAPPDNPFPGSLVYSLGHRDVQGLAFDDKKRLWASEFGQDTYDELNFIRAGRDFGWPVVEGVDGLDRHANPARTWKPEVASPSGLAYAGGALWMGALRGERLWEVVTTDIFDPDGSPMTSAPVAWLEGEYGRIRTVANAPDGSLWVTTSNTDGRGDEKDGDDRILRFTID